MIPDGRTTAVKNPGARAALTIFSAATFYRVQVAGLRALSLVSYKAWGC